MAIRILNFRQKKILLLISAFAGLSVTWTLFLVHSADTEAIIPEQTTRNVEEESACDVIHVVTVVGQLNYLFSFAMFVKSIIAFRKNPIHLHLFVDKESKPVVSEMLESWAIDHFKHHFISIEEHIHHVSNIHNMHYSSHYSQLKLLVPLVLKHLDLVIVADNDLLFTQDIVILWNKLKEMQQQGIPFAMVPEQILQSYVHPDDWPALVSRCHLNNS